MIKVKTIYSKENFLEFQKFHYFHNLRVPRIIFTVLGFVFCLIGISGCLSHSFVFGITEIVFGSFLILEFNTPIMPLLQTRHILKSDSILIGLENEFVFFEDYLEVSNKYSSSKASYEVLYCYTENQNFIYIYMNKMTAFLVDKKGIKEGTLEELNHLLKKKIKKK